MLRMYLGEMENVKHGPSWFRNHFNVEWFRDPFIQEMIQDVDKSRYVDGYIIESPVFGPIPPQMLSGGVQTLIMIYKSPELVFDATSCGDNCARWLLEIGNREDVLINLQYLMRFSEPFSISIENENRVVETYRDYINTAVKYI